MDTAPKLDATIANGPGRRVIMCSTAAWRSSISSAIAIPCCVPPLPPWPRNENRSRWKSASASRSARRANIPPSSMSALIP